MPKKYVYPPAVSFFRKLKVIVDPTHNPLKIISREMKNYGDTYSLFSHFSPHPFIFTKNPDWVQHVLRTNQKNYEKSPFQTEQLARFIGRGLLTNSGEDWLRQRRLIQPGFKRDQIKIIQEVMQEEIEIWLNELPKNQEIDLYPKFNQLTFNIISRTLFGDSIKTEEIAVLAEIITDLQYLYAKITRRPYFMWYFQLSGEIPKGLKQSKMAREILLKIIDQRRKEKPKDDLLQMLMDATYSDTGKTMEDEQLLDEVLILFVAGHETSANALSYIFYLLGKHPDYQDKIIKYLNHLGADALQWEEIFKPSIIQNIINESMRLHPPAWIIDRIALEDDSFGEYHWKKNTIILMVIYALHQNEAYWENPDQFSPERFEKEVKDKPFYPFGLGQRYCIGSHFALLEMELTLRYFFAKYRYDSQQSTVENIALVTLRPDKVVGVIKQREDV